MFWENLFCLSDPINWQLSTLDQRERENNVIQWKARKKEDNNYDHNDFITIRKWLNLVSLVSQLDLPQQIEELYTPWKGHPIYCSVVLPLYIYWWVLTMQIYWWVVKRGLYWTHCDLKTTCDGIIVLELSRDNGDYYPWDINSGHNNTVYSGNENFGHGK